MPFMLTAKPDDHADEQVEVPEARQSLRQEERRAQAADARTVDPARAETVE
jgi:hypothetical protein